MLRLKALARTCDLVLSLPTVQSQKTGWLSKCIRRPCHHFSVPSPGSANISPLNTVWPSLLALTLTAPAQSSPPSHPLFPMCTRVASCHSNEKTRSSLWPTRPARSSSIPSLPWPPLGAWDKHSPAPGPLHWQIPQPEHPPLRYSMAQTHLTPAFAHTHRQALPTTFPTL